MNNNFMRCPLCIGSKLMMGGGMIYQDCTNCDGKGVVMVKFKSNESNENDDYLNNTKENLSKRKYAKKVIL